MVEDAVKKKKADLFISFVLDKVDLVFTAAYALFTQDYWLHIINNKITAPEAAYLVAYSLALGVAWVAIGIIKSRRM